MNERIDEYMDECIEGADLKIYTLYPIKVVENTQKLL